VVDFKKEIKLSDLFGGGKKKQSQDTPRAEPVAEPKTPFWKKEISLARKPKVESVPAPEPVAEPVFVFPDSDGRTAAELFGPLLAGSSPLAPVEATPDPEPQLEVEPEPPAAALELVEAYVPTAPQPRPVEAQVPLADVLPIAPAAPEAEPFAAASDITPAQVPATPLPAEPIVAAPQPVAAAPEPVVVHPPVPAAALPPLPDEQPAEKEKKKEKESTEKAVPFYRRELAFGRRKPKPVADDAEPKSDEKKTKKKENAPKVERAGRSFSLPRPTPRRSRGGKLPNRLVGLKVGASQLAAATVSNNGHAEVLQLAREPLAAGVVAGGELREPDLLAEALKEFFKKHKLPKRGVRLGIATNRIGVRTLEIAGIEDPKQLANAIKFRAQEALPIPIDEAVLDYHILSVEKNAEGETTRKILLVLAYRELIDRYVAACKKAGIQLVGIDLEAFALLRALAAPREEATAAQSAVVAVTVGHDRTTFAVSDGRTCEFTRVLDWGGQSLNIAIARDLDMAPSEVDDFKRSLSLDGVEVPEGLTAEQAQTARDALRKHVQSFARELVSSLQFYQNQPGSLGIGEIVVTGGTAHLAGLAAELQRLIGVRVRVGDPLVRVKLGKKFKEPEGLGSFAVAIGLGIED
jgi:type IV pilus assembly protein PilM